MKQKPDSVLPVVKPPLPSRALASARRLRTEITDAERKLWARLRSRQVSGMKFRRQHPIPPYIVDFCCVDLKLVIELDGSQHSESTDLKRTDFLGAQGWRVLRFWDNDVMSQPEAVLEAIWKFAAIAYPHPNPLPGGEGALEKKP